MTPSVSSSADMIFSLCVQDYLRGLSAPSAELDRLLQVLREEIYRKAVDRSADIAEAWIAHYPTDLFPEEGTSAACDSARMARQVARMIGKEIREQLEDDS